MPLEILYSDRAITVCVKPVGVESEHGMPELLSEELGGDFFPVHRLDQNVGGVMVFARTKAAAAEMNRAMMENAIVKEYFVLVHGVPPEYGRWTDLLWKDGIKNKVYVVNRPRGGVKDAHLEFCRLRTANDRSLVRVRLHTGRSHQIRVQFASRGYPVFGDRKYGARDGLTAPMLFSASLKFRFHGRDFFYESIPDWVEKMR